MRTVTLHIDPADLTGLTSCETCETLLRENAGYTYRTKKPGWSYRVELPVKCVRERNSGIYGFIVLLLGRLPKVDLII